MATEPAPLFNFYIEQGQTWADQILYEPLNTPFVWTGYEVYLRLRSQINGAIVLELNSTNGKLTLPSNGVIQLNASTTDTQPLVPTGATSPVAYYYEVIAVGSSTVPILSGQLIVTPSISRPWSLT